MMLAGISPLLTGEALMHLDRMGHSDALVVADANFPAHRLGAPVIELPGASAPEVLRAVLDVVPLDDDGGALQLMARAGGEAPSGVQLALVAASGQESADYLDRYAFYDAAANASVIIRTGETRAFGNAIVRKGVVLGASHE